MARLSLAGPRRRWLPTRPRPAPTARPTGMREASSAIGSSLRATGEKGSTKILHQATSNLHEAGGRDWYRTHGPSHLFLSYGRRGCARLRKTFIAGPPHARVVVAFDACPAIQDLPLGQCYRIGDFTPRARLCKWCGRYQLVLTWLFILGCAVAAWIVQYGTGYRKGARDAIRDKILKAALDASRR